MSKLSEMIAEKQVILGLTDRQVCSEYGWLQQTYNKWKAGTIPRENAHADIARFLGVTFKELQKLIAESPNDSDSAKVAAFRAAREYGQVSDRKDGKYKFAPSAAGRKAIPEGRYSIRIDTKVMEPALPVGTKAWLDPAVWPKQGYEVLAFSAGGIAWIGVLEEVHEGHAVISRHAAPPVTVEKLQAIHVIVLSERV